MKEKDELRGEERKVVTTRLYRSEFANFVKICDNERKSVHAKLREIVKEEIDRRFGGVGGNKIPTVDEMKKNALKIADNIPNLKEKHKFMTKTRGNIIELSIIIEICFNQLITETGKEIIFNHENKELYLIKGMRNKKDLPKFRTKSRDMKKLIEEIFPKLDESSKLNLLDNFIRFEEIRNIFAHVPVNWDSDQMEFNDKLPYKHFFKLESKWKNIFFALNEFTQLHQWIIDIILNYNRNILLKKEIFSLIFLGKSQADIQAETNKLNEMGRK